MVWSVSFFLKKKKTFIFFTEFLCILKNYCYICSAILWDWQEFNNITFNFITMKEKVFVVSTNGQVAVTNLSFEEISEIIENAIANKEIASKGKHDADKVEVSEKELRESVDEFCFAMFSTPKISTRVLGKELETREVHRKSLAFAKSKGISLMEMFSNLNEMSDDDLASQLKTIFGIDLQ